MTIKTTFILATSFVFCPGEQETQIFRRDTEPITVRWMSGAEAKIPASSSMLIGKDWVNPISPELLQSLSSDTGYFLLVPHFCDKDIDAGLAIFKLTKSGSECTIIDVLKGQCGSEEKRLLYNQLDEILGYFVQEKKDTYRGPNRLDRENYNSIAVSLAPFLKQNDIKHQFFTITNRAGEKHSRDFGHIQLAWEKDKEPILHISFKITGLDGGEVPLDVDEISF